MVPNSFSIGPLTFHIYGLIIAVSIVIGWWLAKKRANFYKIKPELLDHSLMLLPLILGVAGGRLYHVLDKWDYYKSNPDQIIQVSGGGLGIFGALIGIFAGLWIFAKIKNIEFLPLLDLLTPSIILGQAIGRIGNYINQEGFGPPTNLPWGVYIDPAHRPEQYMFFTHFHPTFFYEAILDMAAFLILLFLSSLSSSSLFRHSRESGNRDKLQRGSRFSIWSLTLSVVEGSRMTLHKPGQIFGLYLVLYGASRFIVEFWRIDTAKVGDFKVAYLLSFLLILIGTFLLSLRAERKY